MPLKWNFCIFKFRLKEIGAGQDLQKGIYDKVDFIMYVHVQRAWTCEWPEQYLDGPGFRVEEGVVAVPAQGPAQPQ